MEVKWRTTRCRKCRHNLSLEKSIDTRCMVSSDSVLYITVDNIPDWVLAQINKATWTKGKVNCEKCGGRLGSFDFTNIKLCQLCGGHDVSAVHIQKNRVDLMTHVPMAAKLPRSSIHFATRRATIDHVSNSETIDTTAASHHSPNIQELIACDRSSSGRQPSSHCVLVERLDKTYNDNENTKATALVPTTIYEAVITTGGNQSTVDSDIGDDNPFTVLSELGTESSVGDDVREIGKDVSFRGSTRRNIEPPHTLEVQTIPEPNYPDEFCCAICMDLYYRPHTCTPCNHVFCEACLRRLARERPSLTPCPYCRNIIRECNFDPDLDLKLKTDYPEIYKTRRHNLRKIDSHFYQLPRCSRTQYTQYQLRNYANRNNQNNLILNILYQSLPCIIPIFIYAVIPCLLIYCLFTLIYVWITSLDSYVGNWSQESWHFENANFFVYNCFKLAIHGCSWYNLYYQAMQYRHWYQYIVFFMQFWSVIQMNLFRCVICTLSAECLSRFFIQRQARERRQQ